MSTSLRIGFAGTPDFAAKHLAALIDSPHEVAAVYTQPDKPAGRGKKLTPSAVKTLALDHELPVYQPDTMKSDNAAAEMTALNLDLLIVVAYGQILPQAILDIPKLGCLNVHGSLLPRWRGAAPIQRAIWAGDAETGVTIMQMNAGLDTGDMLLKASLPIEPSDTSASLYDKLAELGPAALIDCLSQHESWQPVPQTDADATYAKKLSKEEALLDWRVPAAQLERNVRAFNPWPVAYFELDGQRIKVWQASVCAEQGEAGTILSADKQGVVVGTVDGALCLESLQFPGKRAMSSADILNARRDSFAIGRSLM